MYIVNFTMPKSFGVVCYQGEKAEISLSRSFWDPEVAIRAVSEMIRDGVIAVSLVNPSGATIFTYRR